MKVIALSLGLLLAGGATGRNVATYEHPTTGEERAKEF